MTYTKHYTACLVSVNAAQHALAVADMQALCHDGPVLAVVNAKLALAEAERRMQEASQEDARRFARASR